MKLFLIIGTYTNGASDGIYVYEFDAETGKSKYVSEIKNKNPSYLVVNHKETHIYSVSENEDAKTSTVNAFSFNKELGKLSSLNSQQVFGAAPCYINIGMKDRSLVTANYIGGSISVFKTNADGSLQPIKQQFKFNESSLHDERQNQSHLHCVVFSPDDEYLFATDLGGDKIYKFNVNYESENNFLTFGEPNYYDVTAGSGPRHLIFHPNEKYAYLINELSGTIVVFNYYNGTLKEIQTTVADKFNAEGSADIHISPDGRFLYASNRLHKDGIAIFSIDENTGMLKKTEYQRTDIHPRNFIITPNGKFLLVANQDSKTIQVFARDLITGSLENTEQSIVLDMPVCLKFISVP